MIVGGYIILTSLHAVQHDPGGSLGAVLGLNSSPQLLRRVGHLLGHNKKKEVAWC